MCSAIKNLGGTIDDSTAAGVPAHMLQIQKPSANMPVILYLNGFVAVAVTYYYEEVTHPNTSEIMNWIRIRKFRLYITACKEWEDPADLPVCSKDVPIM